MAPKFYWDELDNKQKYDQLQIAKEFEELADMVELLLQKAPESVVSELSTSRSSIETWLKFHEDLSFKHDWASNLPRLEDDIVSFESFLDILSQGPEKIIIIPDTNCLLNHPDPVDYNNNQFNDGYEFMLLPTILSELDDHKTNHKVPEVREKAKKAIKRIKGWRNQGGLRKGVTVNSNIVVKASHKEPDMENTLSWLDKNSNDDRIMANILAVQASEPTARLILFTGDINLMNKADAAFIEVGDL